MATKFTKAQLQEAIQSIYSAMIEGQSDEEAAAELGLEAEEFQKLKDAMYDSKSDELRTRPTEHTYVQYIIDQSRNIHDLTDMIADFKLSRNHAAMVGAVKVRSDIMDKLIKFGQEFGIIHKEAKKGELLVGHVVADMTNKQLKTAITAELSALNSLVKKYGDRGIVDMDPGALHRGPRLPPARIEDGPVEPGATVPAAIPRRSKHRDKNAKARNLKRYAGRVKTKR